MKVKDIMNKKVVTCVPGDVVSDVVKKLKKHNISGMPVVEGGKVVGVITERDILGLLRTPEYSKDLWLPSPLELIEVPIRELVDWTKTKKALEDMGDRPVARVMSRCLYVISPEEGIEKAAEMMTKHRVNRLPVTEDDRLVGIVTRGDIIAGLGGKK
ncbi:MAG: CBS domain-containing protein [Methanosarcinales archaeon Met12]|nr:MAG: CBS domain-containing protein [Methanosarcinales archaeon Met12]